MEAELGERSRRTGDDPQNTKSETFTTKTMM